MDTTTIIALGGGLVGIASAVTGALNWFVSSAHGKDSTAHVEQFCALRNELAQRLEAHESNSEAHHAAAHRISLVEADMRHIQQDLLDIKTMLRLLVDQISKAKE